LEPMGKKIFNCTLLLYSSYNFYRSNLEDFCIRFVDSTHELIHRWHNDSGIYFVRKAVVSLFVMHLSS
jgi:hypothetical protein